MSFDVLITEKLQIACKLNVLKLYVEDFLQNEDESHSEGGSDVMECFIHNMLAKEMTLSTEREEEKLFTDTNEN